MMLMFSSHIEMIYKNIAFQDIFVKLLFIPFLRPLLQLTSKHLLRKANRV